VVILVLIVASASISGTTKHWLLGGFPSYLHADKVAHLLGFAALGFAFVRSRFGGVRPWHVLALAFALGILTEVWQRFIPGRTSKASDVLIDLAGACVGVYVARRAWPRSTAGRSD
jgi:VanZ family protein